MLLVLKSILSEVGDGFGEDNLVIFVVSDTNVHVSYFSIRDEKTHECLFHWSKVKKEKGLVI